MAKADLTIKEQKVLYGIVRLPNLNDRELAEKIDVNASTIATIRNKFKNSDYFDIIRFPYMQNLNYQSLVVTYDRISFLVPTSSPLKILENISKTINNYFYMISITDAWLGLAIAKDIVEIQQITDTIAQIKYNNDLSIKTTKHIIFPFKLSQIYNFFDYSYLLEQIFGTELETAKLERDSQTGLPLEFMQEPAAPSETGSEYNSEQLGSELTGANVKFTPAEKRVFLLLNQNPELSDHAIAKKTSLSSTTINTINKRLTEKRLIKKLIIPNLEKLGFELMACTHLKFIPSSTVLERIRFDQHIKHNLPNIFIISNNTNEIIITIHKSFSDYQKINEEIINLYSEKDLLFEDPTSILLPLKEINYAKYHYYQPLLKNSLGVRTELGMKILKIMKEHFGPGGDKILNNQLKRMDLTIDTLSTKDLTEIADEILNVTTPIFGQKRAKLIRKDIKKLTETQ
jgi:DNA-binding MarR family transcriptional regulator